MHSTEKESVRLSVIVASRLRVFQLHLAVWVERVGDTTSRTESRAVRSRGRRVLSIADNPEAASGDQASLDAGSRIYSTILADDWRVTSMPETAGSFFF